MSISINPLLKKGDTIGLVTPSGFINKEKLIKTVNNFKKIGLNTFYFSSVLDKSGYLAGTDNDRIDELHKMYENEDVKAIICVRGGYGVTRILEKLNYNLIEKNAKPLIGYSDITALINAIYKKTEIPGFHGIVGGGDFTDFTYGNFSNMFFGKSEDVVINIFSGHKKEAFVINEGIVSGKLIGGNLSLISNTLGTPFDVSWDNKIVFLEDVGEAPYKIDRMLTHLLSAGKFKNVKAVIFGKFAACETEDKKENSFTLKEIITDRIKPLQVPVIYGYSFGHISNQVIFPTGIYAKLNTEDFSISIKRKEINSFFN